MKRILLSCLVDSAQCASGIIFQDPRTKCLGSVEQVALSSEGTVYSFTVIRTKAPMGLPEPYGVGYVDLAGSGLRIFCLLDPEAIDNLCVGAPVRLRVGQIGNDVNGNLCLRPYFTPLNKI